MIHLNISSRNCHKNSPKYEITISSIYIINIGIRNKNKNEWTKSLIINYLTAFKKRSYRLCTSMMNRLARIITNYNLLITETLIELGDYRSS